MQSAPTQATPGISAKRNLLRFVLINSCFKSLFLSQLRDLKETLLFLVLFAFFLQGLPITPWEIPAPREVRPKEIRRKSLCRVFFLLPNRFPFPAGEVSPPALTGLPVYFQRSCGTLNCFAGAFPTSQLSISLPRCRESWSCRSPPPSRSVLHAG